jgi:hypothetical protein
VDPNPDWIRIELGQRIRIQRNQNGYMKRKISDISCFEEQGARLGKLKATSGSGKSNVEVLQEFYSIFSSNFEKDGYSFEVFAMMFSKRFAAVVHKTFYRYLLILEIFSVTIIRP